MRLGQLARKLELSPTEIISFLLEKNISATEGSNTRLSSEHVSLICQKFDPSDSKQIISGSLKKEEPEPVISVAALPEVVENSVDEIKPVQEEAITITEAVSEQQTVDEDKIEVIKAPKVELSGLKILGKIELPQPKKKEPVADQPAPEIQEGQTPPVESVEPPVRRTSRHENRKFTSPKNPRQTNGKNSVALQREREAREAERKREEESKLQKEKRTQYYLQKVKSVPTKAARIIDEDVVEMEIDTTVKKMPTTWIGKFWRWFRS